MHEVSHKLNKLRDLMQQRDLEAILLRRISSFAWATCGASSYINTATLYGEGMLLITEEDQFLLTNNIEAPRFEEEEGLKEQGWEFHIVPWHKVEDSMREIVGARKLGADDFFPGATDLSVEMARLRSHLTHTEGERIRALGKECASAMDATVRQLEPGMTEFAIAGLAAHELGRRGVHCIVNLIATDERISSFRHPLPTSKQLERFAMIVLCGRRQGLVASITRLVHFGSLPAVLGRLAEDLAKIDAAFISATRPGRTQGEVFELGLKAYASAGYPGEWRLHHQGGVAGFEPRELIATRETEEAIVEGQAYAWNPSITGTKSEDTILVGREENELLTAIEGWPTIEALGIEGGMVERPAILEIT
jgi:antitoxin VapB